MNMDIILNKELIDELLSKKLNEHQTRRQLSDYVLMQHQLQSKKQVSVEPEVIVKLADIKKLIKDKENMHEEKYKEFVNETRNVMNGHWIKAETCREILLLIESKFSE